MRGCQKHAERKDLICYLPRLPDGTVVTQQQLVVELSALRLEVAAWRALAEYSADGSSRLLFDAEVSQSLEQHLLAYAERSECGQLDMGDGPTVQAAAIALARQLQLIPAEPDGAKP